jgi:hypothetical protein
MADTIENDPTLEEEPVETPEETPAETAQVVYDNLDTESKVQVGLGTTLALLWVGLGLASLVAAFTCLGMDGATTPSIAGIFLAILLGPFYWIYFGILKHKGQYCMAKKK